jgi:hypothetical protein
LYDAASAQSACVLHDAAQGSARQRKRQRRTWIRRCEADCRRLCLFSRSRDRPNRLACYSLPLKLL